MFLCQDAAVLHGLKVEQIPVLHLKLDLKSSHRPDLVFHFISVIRSVHSGYQLVMDVKSKSHCLSYRCAYSICLDILRHSFYIRKQLPKSEQNWCVYLYSANAWVWISMSVCAPHQFSKWEWNSCLSRLLVRIERNLLCDTLQKILDIYLYPLCGFSMEKMFAVSLLYSCPHIPF